MEERGPRLVRTERVKREPGVPTATQEFRVEKLRSSLACGRDAASSIN